MSFGLARRGLSWRRFPKLTLHRESVLLQLFRNTPLTFKLACKDAVLETLGDAVRLCAELTPEQRETYWWKLAVHTLNGAIREPKYITAATVTLQTALNLSGMLAEPPETP
jgi:hypothetical protein